MRMTKSLLKKWEKEMDDINVDNIYYTTKSPISMRYINDGYVWSNIVRKIRFSANKVLELCPGNSLVIDLALSFLNFNGVLIKADLKRWNLEEKIRIKRPFRIKLQNLNVVQDVNKLIPSNLLILNHGIDDLFIGLWAKEAKIDYYGYTFKKIKENNKYWKKAMSKSEKYIKILKKFFQKLTDRIEDGGFIIIKSCPCGFETHFQQSERVNFTFQLTDLLVKEIKNCGFKIIDINLDDIPGPKGSKFPDSFRVLKKLS